VVNAPKRVEVPKKTTQTPSVVKRGRVTTTKRDNAPNKRPRKEKTLPLQNENASTSENLDDLILGNYEASMGIQEISINYTSSREVYDCSTIIVNPCFLTIIADNFLADLGSWQSAQGAQTGTNRRKQLRLSVTRLRRERCSLT
jgi:hypothetical protein